MRIYTQRKEIERFDRTAVTLGTFDGVHTGHRQILSEVQAKAASINGRSFAITFEPHPRVVLGSAEPIILTLLSEKLALFEEAGIEHVFVIPFTREFAQLPPRVFLEEYILDTIGVSEMVIGHDHRFGKGRGGDEETLRALGEEFGFRLTRVDAVTDEGKTISSSIIRRSLQYGDIETANRYLGRYYSFTGKVLEGEKRGRTLGFPTANIDSLDPKKLLPARGVYSVLLTARGEQYKGMMNIGVRPTFMNASRIFIEVHVFEFNGDLYGEEVTVSVVKRIRDEKKFSSVDELAAQLQIDKKTAANENQE